MNPTATILSGVLMLRHLGETNAADRIEAAVAKVIAEGKDVTYDMKADRNDPTAVGTREMAEAIVQAMNQPSFAPRRRPGKIGVHDTYMGQR